MDFSTVGIEAGIGASYSLGGGLSVEGEFLYQNDASTAFVAGTSYLKALVADELNGTATAAMGDVYEDGVISGMVGLTMGFSNGLIGIALEVTTGNFVGSGQDITKDSLSDLAWAIPVRFEYWF
jgi:hypothetical protein